MVGRPDDIAFDRQIVVEEVGRIGIVGQYSADLGGRRHDQVRSGLRQPVLHVRLAAQIETGAFNRYHLAVLAGQAPSQGAANHAPVTGDPNPTSRDGASHGG